VGMGKIEKAKATSVMEWIGGEAPTLKGGQLLLGVQYHRITQV